MKTKELEKAYGKVAANQAQPDILWMDSSIWRKLMKSVGLWRWPKPKKGR